jgi:hypothetical protein
MSMTSTPLCVLFEYNRFYRTPIFFLLKKNGHKKLLEQTNEQLANSLGENREEKNCQNFVTRNFLKIEKSRICSYHFNTSLSRIFHHQSIIFNPYFTKCPFQSYFHTQITKIHKPRKTHYTFFDPHRMSMTSTLLCVLFE